MVLGVTGQELVVQGAGCVGGITGVYCNNLPQPFNKGGVDKEGWRELFNYGTDSARLLGKVSVLLLLCTRRCHQNTVHPDPKVANNCLDGACPTLGKSIGVAAGDKENMATSLSASQHLLGGRKGTMQVTALAPGLH